LYEIQIARVNILDNIRVLSENDIDEYNNKNEDKYITNNQSKLEDSPI